MKQASIVTSVILAVAVLVAAYAIGRLIRQARMEGPETTKQVVAPNDPNMQDQINASRRISRKRTELTAEDRAKIKEQRLQELEARTDLTEEQKAQRREEIAQAVSAKRKEPGQIPRLSPRELAELSKRLQGMSEEEKAAFLASRKARVVTSPNLPAGTAAEDLTAAKPSTMGSPNESPTSDPNQN